MKNPGIKRFRWIGNAYDCHFAEDGKTVIKGRRKQMVFAAVIVSR
jgi:hypothetical protein